MNESEASTAAGVAGGDPAEREYLSGTTSNACGVAGVAGSSSYGSAMSDGQLRRARRKL